MQVFMSKDETLDMLEKISFRGHPVKAQLDSKFSIDYLLSTMRKLVGILKIKSFFFSSSFTGQCL